jgi:lipopolysaccharide transport system permease protein
MHKNSTENTSHTEDWDMVIKPTHSVFQLNLKDVWAYRDLLTLLVRRDFVSFYKQTILGPIWFFIQPLFTTLIYVFVFGSLAGLSTDGLPQPLFYMTGIVMWNYFSECLIKTSTVFKDNANLFGKVYFPRLVMPLSIVVSNLVRLGVQLILLILVIAYYALFKGYVFKPTPNLLLMPYLIFLMAILGLGLGLIITAMTTRYRDLSYLVGFGVQLLMYATPVIYPMSAASEKIRSVIAINPLSHIIEAMRYGLLGTGSFTWSGMIYVSIVSFVILLIGMVVFNKVEKSFVDTI